MDSSNIPTQIFVRDYYRISIRLAFFNDSHFTNSTSVFWDRQLTVNRAANFPVGLKKTLSEHRFRSNYGL